MIPSTVSSKPDARGAPGRIVARGLTKRYAFHQMRKGTVKELFIHALRGRRKVEEVPALDGLDLEVSAGEAIGVIGANGSGKSTLLKLIAGITPATAGSVTPHGRVASLLELGVGFHPDLSGMENIFQMGSMLGMPRSEVLGRLEGILAFADVGRFIHTPVKHYSTGMAVRLGFSLATSLDPDIILLDEVISVGDTDFQAKSFERIHDLHASGKTLVLVTHKLEEAERACDKILWLDKGRAVAFGPTGEVLTQFQNHMFGNPSLGERIPFRMDLTHVSSTVRMGSGEVDIEKVEMLDASGRPSRRFRSGRPMLVRIHYRVRRPVADLAFNIGLAPVIGGAVALANSGEQTRTFRPQNRGRFDCLFDPLLLTRGAYTLSIGATPHGRMMEPYDAHIRAYPFEVEEASHQPLHPALNLPCRVAVSVHGGDAQTGAG